MKIFKNLNFSVLPAIVVFAFSGMASAQSTLIKGSEEPLFSSGDVGKTQCFAYKKYVVKTIRRENAATASGDDRSGDDISIFKRDALNSPQKNCQTVENALLSVENTEGNIFLGIFKDLVFIEKNLYPDYSNLEIYDLKTNKIVFKTEYTEYLDTRLNISNGKFLLYDKWSKKDGLLKNCRGAERMRREGLGIGWLQAQRLNLQTLKAMPVGALRCTSLN